MVVPNKYESSLPESFKRLTMNLWAVPELIAQRVMPNETFTITNIIQMNSSLLIKHISIFLVGIVLYSLSLSNQLPTVKHFHK
jgi:hypothetical protein